MIIRKMVLVGCTSIFFFMTACTAHPTITGFGWTHERPVQPSAGDWKKIDFVNGNEYRVEAPPSNDSEITSRELAELRELTASLTEEDIRLVKYWDNTPSPGTHWIELTEQLIAQYRLSGPEAARVHAVVSGGIYTALTATFQAKYDYLRPRPTDLDPSITLIDGVSVPAHPSYPAGHTSAAWTAAYLLSHYFPKEKAMLEQTAETVGLTRMQAGVHFRGDNEASKKLAEAVAMDVIEGLQDDDAPLNYMEANQMSGH